jgi:hypothetical protein
MENVLNESGACHGRRAVLAAIVVGAAALALPGAALAQSDDGVGGLWARRHALRAPTADALAAIAEANARLPAWARPGPQHIDDTGAATGDVVGWPAIEGVTARRGFLAVARPGLADLRERFDAVRHFEPVAALRAYRAALRALAVRRRAQAAETAKAGLDAAEARWTALDEARKEIEAKILALDLSTVGAVAAQIVVGLNYDVAERPDETAGERSAAQIALAFLRPSLAGLLRAHVDEILDSRLPARALQAFIGFDAETAERA